MRKDIIEKIAAQALDEIQFARTFKQSKTLRWRINEQMYYGNMPKIQEARASVQLGRMQEFVHTLLSKIDNPLVFKYTKRKNAQSKRVDRLNALRQIDQKTGAWDIKDIVGKKQGIIYGRAIYNYYAESPNGNYISHLDNIDVYDFLIDPSCGGIDIDAAKYLGSYDVIMDKSDLEEGRKKGIYLKDGVKCMIDGSGNANDSTQEQTNKQFRSYDVRTTGQKENNDPSKYRFWRWFTTYEGDRIYLLMSDSGDVIRCEYMDDVLPTTEDRPKGMWPYWTWAAFPDLTEFWTPSYCDYVREVLMAQDVTVNQALDNAEAINKPMKAIDVSAIENLAELKYRRDGIIKMKGGTDMNRAMQIIQTPSIETPLKLFQLLESIQEKSSGVSAQSKGVADEAGKVGIYEGNEAAAADRFGLLNKSYSFGYERFAELYEMGVREHLIKRVAIEIMGPNGVELANVKKSDIFKSGDKFGVMVEASNAQMLASEQNKRAKDAFLLSLTNSPHVNKKKLDEMRGEIAGITQEQLDELFDTSNFGTASLLSDADADLEEVLLGDKVSPNRAANNAYKQRFVDYMSNHSKELSNKEWARLEAYITSLEPVVLKNEARRLQNEQTQSLLKRSMMMETGMPGMGAPQPPQGQQPLPPSGFPAK